MLRRLLDTGAVDAPAVPVTVDGQPNRQGCRVAVAAGMWIETRRVPR